MHTPGPWTAHSGSVYKDGPNVWPKGDDLGIPIARMDREAGNGTWPPERDANAHLIAAAPDLLAAAEAVRLALEGSWAHGELAGAKHDDPHMLWLVRQSDTLAAAIKKAKVQQP